MRNVGKRISEQRCDEAQTVIDDIRQSIEKAKAIIEQFKSLARAQEIKLSPIPLEPILNDACKLAGNQGINCTFDCPSYLVAIADSEKLAECFDELITNATHWFDKPNKELKIKAMISLPGLLPNGLDPTKSYVLISVEDNGCGIPINEKGKIFDAFVGKYQHGTGLGLALVRRIIEGHGGEIFESGIPGKGADFRIYIPSSESCYRLPNDEN